MWWKSIQLRKLEKLGEGGQGEVYRALRLDPDSGLNQIVALKILHSKTAVDLWRQEFESLAKVRSHYCVRVLSFERHSGRPALVLEYVEGLSLAHLAQSCCLEPDDIEEVLAQIEHGLNDLHRFGVIHGDLSPHNILVDVSGQIKLLDFGLANCSLEKPRMTPQFAAPERLAGARPQESSDIFSLGCIEEFLTGQSTINSVYKALEPAQRTWRGLGSEPKRASELGAKVRAMRQRMNQIFITQTQAEAAPSRRPMRAFVAGVILASTVLFLPKASSNFSRTLPAQLIIRTQHWHRFRLNGRELGFAPLTVLVEADQIQHLSWTSASGKTGLRNIHLQPGESAKLVDSDFSH